MSISLETWPRASPWSEPSGTVHSSRSAATFKLASRNVDDFAVMPRRRIGAAVAVLVAVLPVLAVLPAVGLARSAAAPRPQRSANERTLPEPLIDVSPSPMAARAISADDQEERAMLDVLAHASGRRILTLVGGSRALVQGDYSGAIGLFDEAKPIAESFPIFRRRYSTALLCNGDRTAAEMEMRGAVEAQSSATNLGYWALAMGGLRWACPDHGPSMAAGGDVAAALDVARQAAALSEGTDQRLWLGVGAEMAIRAGDTAALGSISDLLDFIAPASPAALRYRAWRLVLGGNLAGADAVLAQLRRLTGHAPRAKDLVAARSRPGARVT